MITVELYAGGGALRGEYTTDPLDGHRYREGMKLTRLPQNWQSISPITFPPMVESIRKKGDEIVDFKDYKKCGGRFEQRSFEAIRRFQPDATQIVLAEGCVKDDFKLYRLGTPTDGDVLVFSKLMSPFAHNIHPYYISKGYSFFDMSLECHAFLGRDTANIQEKRWNVIF